MGQETHRTADQEVGATNLRINRSLLPQPVLPQPAHERGRTADGESHEIALVLPAMNNHACFNGRQHSALLLRNPHFDREDQVDVQGAVNGLKKRLGSLARASRDGHFAGLTFAALQQSIALVLVEQVDLVQNFNAWLGENIQLA